MSCVFRVMIVASVSHQNVKPFFSKSMYILFKNIKIILQMEIQYVRINQLDLQFQSWYTEHCWSSTTAEPRSQTAAQRRYFDINVL